MEKKINTLDDMPTSQEALDILDELGEGSFSDVIVDDINIDQDFIDAIETLQEDGILEL